MNRQNNDTSSKTDTRQRLLDVAEALFDRQGFKQTTIQQIAEQADVSPGLIYHYFASKQDILTSIQDAKTERLLKLLKENPELSSHGAGLQEAMVIMTMQLTELPFDQVCQTITPPNGNSTPGSAFMALLKAAVRDAQATGELTTQVPPDVIVRDLIAAGIGVILQWCNAGGCYDVVAEQRRFMQRFLHGLRPD